MANTSLSPELIESVQKLSESFAQSQQVIAAKARIGLFYQSPEATDLFRKVNEFGEELRNKQMAGMTPSEEEISQFDEMRQNVIANPLCVGFLESRQQLDELLSTVNQYLCLAIDMGRSPSDEEVAKAMDQQNSMSSSCCGGSCGCSDEERESCGCSDEKEGCGCSH